MTHRFTLKELETLSDNEILGFLVRDHLENKEPYAMIRTRFGMIMTELDKNLTGNTLNRYLKYLGKTKR